MVARNLFLAALSLAVVGFLAWHLPPLRLPAELGLGFGVLAGLLLWLDRSRT